MKLLILAVCVAVAAADSYQTYDKRAVGYGKRDYGYGGYDRGYGGYDRGYDSGYGRRDYGYGRRDYGYGRRDYGYGRRDYGYDNDYSYSAPKKDSYEPKKADYSYEPKNDYSYEPKKDSYAEPKKVSYAEPKKDSYEAPKRSYGNTYYGKYPGKCGNDGLYFRDEKSFVFCSNGNSYVQPCAPGTRNSPYEKYSYGKNYDYRDFCDVNLVDGGYAAVHSKH